MHVVPKYYSYMIIFRGEVEEVQPIIGVYDLEKLRLDNYGRMHLFDDMLIPILPAVEYCLHMPRTEMDLYDIDTRVLDNAYDVSHNLCIIPDTAPYIEQMMSHFTFIIYVDDCLECVKTYADRQAYLKLGNIQKRKHIKSFGNHTGVFKHRQNTDVKYTGQHQ